MYLDILKRDVKRKKTMNIILLLFTILAATFVSSGLSNVITVMNGTDYFLDKAGIGDYMGITQGGDGGVRKILDQSSNVKSYRVEKGYWVSKDNLTLHKKHIDMKNNAVMMQSIDNKGIRYFQTDNSILTKVKKGDIYVTTGFLKKNGLKIGDNMQVTLGNTSKAFRIAGEIKDALLGSEMMGNIRLLLNEEDYQIFAQDKSLAEKSGYIFYIDSDQVDALSAELSGASNLLFDGTRSTIKLCYVMEMIVAMVVLVLSVCLIIVSFVLLKFVITFSINEEFREIGVMKAIGIKDRKIRGLYVVKYFAMAVVGGSIGLLISFPFGNMLIRSVSKKMVLGNDKGSLLNVIGAIVVILLMVAFTYLCTGRVKKATPVDAIRNGQTGERYKKKRGCSLRKTHTNVSMYMAMNDICSSPKRFATIIASFFLCSIFVLGVVLVTDTMKSKNLITTFGKESDVYITDAKLMKMDFIGRGGDTGLAQEIKRIESDLKEHGMAGTVSMEVWYKYNFESNGKVFTGITCQQNKKTKTTDYEYIEGSAPQNADEIAITPTIAKQIHAKIGDTVTMDYGTEKRECMVVGYFQTLNQLGKVIRLHQDTPTSMKYSSAMMAFQIDFADHPNKKEIASRIEKIKKMYDVEDVLNAEQFCSDCIGVVGTMEAVSKLLLCITCLVVVLVTVLMERTFIADEAGQIAFLKSIGFKDRVIVKWQIKRFMLVGIIAEVAAILLTVPVTKLWCNPIWHMMGAENVKYYFNPFSLVVLYPGIVLLITGISASIAALFTKRISSRELVNVE